MSAEAPTSTTDLTPEKKGRVIATLRRVTAPRNRYRYHNGRWQMVYGKRVYTDEEISALVDVPVKDLDKVQNLYSNPKWGPRYDWTPEEIADKLIAFANREGRWPTGRELRKRKSLDLDLPSWYVIQSRWGPWRGYHWGIQEHIIRSGKFKKLNYSAILSIPNMTLRKEAMEKKGVDKLMKSKGELIRQDDFGKLWRLPTDNTRDPHMQMVEVINSTPEPDGSYARYFLRVPPTIERAAQAVSWTFEQDDDLKVVAES